MFTVGLKRLHYIQLANCHVRLYRTSTWFYLTEMPGQLYKHLGVPSSFLVCSQTLVVSSLAVPCPFLSLHSLLLFPDPLLPKNVRCLSFPSLCPLSGLIFLADSFIFTPLSHYLPCVVPARSLQLRVPSPSSFPSLPLHFLSRSQSSPFPRSSSSSPSRVKVRGGRVEPETGKGCLRGRGRVVRERRGGKRGRRTVMMRELGDKEEWRSDLEVLPLHFPVYSPFPL